MKPSILYIDDDPVSVEVLKRMLNPYNLNVHVEVNGTTGSEAFERLAPDLVFLDIGLPGISGLVALRRMRKFAVDNRLKVKIIMLTASDEKEDFETALKYGATDYILKPFEQGRLLEKLKKHFPGIV